MALPTLSATAGTEAQATGALGTVLLLGASVLFVLTMLLLWRASQQGPRRVNTALWLWGGGVLLPGLLLPGLWWWDRAIMARAAQAPPPGTWVVGITARPWWWELRLQHPEGGPDIVLANELVLPAGRPVRLALTAEGMIHSLWVPALAGKVDLVPGRLQHLLLQPLASGQWRAPCAEFCGLGHTRMVLQVRALPPADHERWWRSQAAVAAAPADARQARGRALFTELRCSTCHAVRGVAQAQLSPQLQGGDAGGPDLTHLASRATLAAGTLQNNPAQLRAWITDVQRFKPGARMPSYAHLDDESLDALVAWLGSLQ